MLSDILLGKKQWQTKHTFLYHAGFEPPNLRMLGKRLIHYTVCAQVEGPLSQLAFILSIAVKNLSLSNFSMHAHTFYLRSDKSSI